jgi:signal transduction histidine kinase
LYDRAVRLRRRLNTVLLQWFLLFGGVAGAIWFISFPAIRSDVVSDRLLLARAIARSLDATISTSIQALGRLTADLPIRGPEAASRLRAFRFESPFGEACYLLDSQGVLIAGDPPDAVPLAASWLGYHEAVTPLVTKPDALDRAVLAIIQPFKRGGSDYYVVAEMNPRHSGLNEFLRKLEPAPTLRVSVIDDRGAIVAAPDAGRLLQALAGADALTDRIRAHRAHVIESEALTVMAPLEFASWGVVIQQANANAYAGLSAMSRGLIISGIGIAILGVVVARTLSKSVVGPIRRLSQEASVMRGGNLSRPITASGDYEIETLARTLDEARTRLSATLGELQAFNVRLEDEVQSRTAVIVQQDEQRRALVHRLLAATEDERRRLARELHDEIAQLLTVIQLSLHRIASDAPELRRASELLVRTQKEIHRIIYDLRPSLLDDLGLPAAMKSYAEDHLRREGLHVSLEIEEGMPSRPEIETVIFRIYQELVTNVLRHANAEQVSIELYERDGTLVLAVEDDGEGFDVEAKAGGAGMTGMRERAALVNGTVRFDSEPGAGTHVVVEIPLS